MIDHGLERTLRDFAPGAAMKEHGSLGWEGFARSIIGMHYLFDVGH
jgi:hypothetical protein